MNEQADFLDLLQTTPRAPERHMPMFEDMDWQEEKRRLLMLRGVSQSARNVPATGCYPLPPDATECSAGA